jgi:putative peptidoglycan lipid II flippase
VRRIVRLMLPAIFGSSVAQISILFNTWVASFLAAGSVSWLYYSDRLVEFPLGVFGIALATVILPRLSAQHTNASPDEFSRTLDWALKLVLVIGVPAALGLMLLAEPMLTAMFLGGAFGLEDVQMASASLRAFAPGLLGFILVKVLAPGFFARQDTRTPVRIGVRALLIGMGLNIVFVLTLIATGWAPPHAGLAAATSAAALLNSTLLFMALRRERVYLPGRGWTVLAIRVAVASIAMTVFLFVFEARMVELAAIGKWSQVGLLGLAVAGGALAYFAAAAAAGLRPRDLSLR